MPNESRHKLTRLTLLLAVIACSVMLPISSSLAKKGGGKPGGDGGGGEQPLTNPAFVYRDYFDRSLHLISSDGLQHQQLTKTKGKQGDLAPAWSPDLDDSAEGYQGLIAFLRRPDQSKIWSDLYTIRPDGTDLTYIRSFDGWEDPVPDGTTVQLTWSPDGSRIIYSTWDGLWAVDMNGNLEYLLQIVATDNWSVDAPDFSPDLDPAAGYQGLIAFGVVDWSGTAQQRDIWTLDIEIAVGGTLTTGATQNLTNGSHINPTRPKWSPDGSCIAFHNFDVAANDIVLLDFISNQASIVFTKQHAGSDTSITWSPDGSYIGFDDHDDTGTDTRDLFYVSPWHAGSPIINVTMTPGQHGEDDLDWNPSWANDIDP